MAEPAGPEDLRRARSLFEHDRVWCAYALADLEPPYADRTSWFVGERAAAMLYRGLTPPILFAHGEPEEVDRLLRALPPGEVQYGLLATHRVRLGARLQSAREVHMWRMCLRPAGFPAGAGEGSVVLRPDDLAEIVALFDGHADRPDSFETLQLEHGLFFGVRQGERLVAAAGTHVLSESASVAAVGNVFTDPAHRRRGHGRRASAGLVTELLRRGLRTIVLNVAMANDAALALYRGLGFMPFCGYYEGVGELREG